MNVFSPTKLQKKQKEAKNILHFFLFLTLFFFLKRPFLLTFRDAHQKPLTSYDPLRGVKPTRGDHSLWPFSHGNRAC